MRRAEDLTRQQLEVRPAKQAHDGSAEQQLSGQEIRTAGLKDKQQRAGDGSS